MGTKPRRQRSIYALVFLTVALAAGTRWALGAIVDEESLTFALFVPAIMASGWYGGPRPALVATLLSGLAADFLWDDPVYTLFPRTAEHTVTFVLFLLIGALSAGISAALRRAVEVGAQREAGERRYRELAEAIPQVVWTALPDGRPDFVNERWREFTGDGLPDNIAVIVHPEYREAFSESWRRALIAGSTLDIEVPLRRRDGAWVWHLLRAVPLYDHGRGVLRWLGTATDVDRDKRARDAEVASITSAGRRKDEFLATLAHELRNPLAPIMTSLEILRSTSEPSTLQRHRAVIERQVRGMARLLDDLLDVARVTRGTVELRKQPIDLGSVVLAALETSRPLIEEKHHEITVDLSNRSLRVDGDPLRLEQVVTNLLTNAAKYTEPGGRITVSMTQEDGSAVVRVRDTGIGISSELLPRVFDLFTQADQSLDRRRGGLGIGLTVARRLVEMHGGQVEARSAGLNQGSEFEVRLPVLREGAAVAAAPASVEPNAAPGRRPRVLVVDDSVDTAETASELFSLWGCETRSAFDGPTAVEAAETFHPDLVLLDIGLPGLDGYQVAKRIREGPAGDTRLVAVTGYGQPSDRARSRQAGFDEHLTKPLDGETLRHLLDPVH